MTRWISGAQKSVYAQEGQEDLVGKMKETVDHEERSVEEWMGNLKEF